MIFRNLAAFGGLLVTIFAPSVVPDQFEPLIVVVGIALMAAGLWPRLKHIPTFFRKHVLWRFRITHPTAVAEEPKRNLQPDMKLREVMELVMSNASLDRDDRGVISNIDDLRKEIANGVRLGGLKVWGHYEKCPIEDIEHEWSVGSLDLRSGELEVPKGLASISYSDLRFNRSQVEAYWS